MAANRIRIGPLGVPDYLDPDIGSEEALSRYRSERSVGLNGRLGGLSQLPSDVAAPSPQMPRVRDDAAPKMPDFLGDVLQGVADYGAAGGFRGAPIDSPMGLLGMGAHAYEYTQEQRRSQQYRDAMAGDMKLGIDGNGNPVIGFPQPDGTTASVQVDQSMWNSILGRQKAKKTAQSDALEKELTRQQNDWLIESYESQINELPPDEQIRIRQLARYSEFPRLAQMLRIRFDPDADDEAIRALTMAFDSSTAAYEQRELDGVISDMKKELKGSIEDLEDFTSEMLRYQDPGTRDTMTRQGGYGPSYGIANKRMTRDINDLEARIELANMRRRLMAPPTTAGQLSLPEYDANKFPNINDPNSLSWRFFDSAIYKWRYENDWKAPDLGRDEVSRWIINELTNLSSTGPGGTGWADADEEYWANWMNDSGASAKYGAIQAIQPPPPDKRKPQPQAAGGAPPTMMVTRAQVISTANSIDRPIDFVIRGLNKKAYEQGEQLVIQEPDGRLTYQSRVYSPPPERPAGAQGSAHGSRGSATGARGRANSGVPPKAVVLNTAIDEP